MSTVDEIVTAASQLDSDEFLRLREALDQLEEQVWQTELTRVTERLERAHVTDEDIDRLVIARRRDESRS